MIISKNTKSMTKAEIRSIQNKLKESDKKEIKVFRESFHPDEMGFEGRREGI